MTTTCTKCTITKHSFGLHLKISRLFRFVLFFVVIFDLRKKQSAANLLDSPLVLSPTNLNKPKFQTSTKWEAQSQTQLRASFEHVTLVLFVESSLKYSVSFHSN